MKELRYYVKLLELGRISRREFIGRAVALGATAALANKNARIAWALLRHGGTYERPIAAAA